MEHTITSQFCVRKSLQSDFAFIVATSRTVTHWIMAHQRNATYERHNNVQMSLICLTPHVRNVARLTFNACMPVGRAVINNIQRGIFNC